MLNKCTWILMFLAVGLLAGGAHAEFADVYTNGDFEADAALVPIPGDTDPAAPTGWQYSDYYGYAPTPVLMNVSDIGDGSGGTVGVKFPNWNVDGGWGGLITRYDGPIEPGQYRYTVSIAGEGLIGAGNWILSELWWTNNLADPWADPQGEVYDLLTGTGWVELTAEDNDQWGIYQMDFDILPGDPAVGTYFSPWIHAENYDGNIIIGEASLVLIPEPTSMVLAVIGVCLLLGFRRRRR